MNVASVASIFKEIAGCDLEIMGTGGNFQSLFHELNTQQDYLLICDAQLQDLPTAKTKELILSVHNNDDCVMWSTIVDTSNDLDGFTRKLKSIFELWGAWHENLQDL